MVNKVILIGNLGQDIKLINFDGGNCIGTTSLATTRSWKDKQTNEKKEKTEWHKLVFRNKAAEVAEKYVGKGSKMYIEGELQYREYEKDGEKKYITEISVYEFKFLSSKNEDMAPILKEREAIETEEEIEEDGVPF